MSGDSGVSVLGVLQGELMPESPGSEGARSRRRVLLVDADEARRSSLAAQLREAGYEVQCACTPLGAIACACEEPIGLLILGRPHGAAGAADLLEYFASADPAIRRVLIWQPGTPEVVDEGAVSLAHLLLPIPSTRTDLSSLAQPCAEGGGDSKETKP